jgi:L-seryl-tRNA(Ser) seleniumtransferase
VLRERTEQVRGVLADKGVEVTLVESVAVVGGGGAPEVTLASWSLSLPEGYAVRLRRADPPVVGRVERGRLLLDLRCVPTADDPALIAAVLGA